MEHRVELKIKQILKKYFRWARLCEEITVKTTTTENFLWFRSETV